MNFCFFFNASDRTWCVLIWNEFGISLKHGKTVRDRVGRSLRRFLMVYFEGSTSYASQAQEIRLAFRDFAELWSDSRSLQVMGVVAWEGGVARTWAHQRNSALFRPNQESFDVSGGKWRRREESPCEEQDHKGNHPHLMLVGFLCESYGLLGSSHVFKDTWGQNGQSSQSRAGDSW